MNKKLNTFFFSVLVAVYTCTSVGIPVYLHYCGGELEDVSAFVKKVSCCEGEDEQEADGCCNNVTNHLSYKADFLFSQPIKMDVVKAFHFSYNLSFFGNNKISSVYKPIALEKIIPDIPPSQKSHTIIYTGVFKI